MTPTNVRSVLVVNRAILVALAAFTLLLGIDLVMDFDRGTSHGHALIESSAIVAAALAVALIARQLRALAQEAHELRAHTRELTTNLAESRSDAERWRREAGTFIAGLGAAIDRQFDGWALSPAEKEIALLLLKGLEHKEIAELRGVEETTVRQQARSIYRKGGLAGRHDLAAFFLEDLLGPRAP